MAIRSEHPDTGLPRPFGRNSTRTETPPIATAGLLEALAGFTSALAHPGDGLAAALDRLATGPLRAAALYVLHEDSEWQPAGATGHASGPGGFGPWLEWRYSQVAHQGQARLLPGGDESAGDAMGTGGSILLVPVPGPHPAVLAIRFEAAGVPPDWRTVADLLGSVTGQYLAARRAGARVATLGALLRQQATSDPLTGLPNQVEFGTRVEQALAGAEGNGGMVAVAFIDLDRFRTVNDVLGHAAGDKLLQQVAGRLVDRLGRGNVFRMAGDEFVLVREGVAAGGDYTGAFGAVRSALERPFLCDGHELFVTASTGIAVYPYDGEDVATLVKNADCAMFRAKERGGDTVECYSQGLFEEARRRLSLERSLRRALDGDEIILEYQPQIDLVSGRLVGVEALARWRHPELGILAPATFMPLAEETGLVVPIGQRIIEMACGLAAEWAPTHPEVRVWVNVSARQFHQGDLTGRISRALDVAGIPPESLGVEITESLAMRHPTEAAAVLRQLAEIGVQSALDDFGTGYSSLAYLSRFSVDVLKLDRTFVQSAPSDRHDAAIARAVIALAHGLGITVLAEGVETEPQRAFLTGEGCDQAQGFLLGRPAPRDVTAGFVTASPPAGAGVPPAMFPVPQEG